MSPESQPVRLGVLGTARIAGAVVPQAQASAYCLVTAVASRSLSKAREFAARHQIPMAFGSYEELLNSPDVDAVYVPLPPAMHHDWTLRAAQAGKHVLCEKPMSLNARETADMIRFCRAAGVVLMDSVMWYHTERARRMRQLIGEGQLGEIRQITSAFTFPGDGLATDNIRFQSALGGGSLLDVGWYCVGLSLWTLGDLPTRVFAAAQWRNQIDWRMNGLMWFPSAAVASFECGFHSIRRRWMEVAGTTSALVCDDFTRPWNPERPRFWIHDAQGASQQHVCEHPPIERCLLEAFCELIRTQQICHAWTELSLQTQLVCDALLRSAQTGVAEAVRTESEPE